MGHIEEENLVLTLENAQQPARPQHLPIGGQSEVMRLIPGCARTGQRNGGDDAAVTVRFLVEIDDRKKVGIGPGLVSSPDKQVFFASFLFRPRLPDEWLPNQ